MLACTIKHRGIELPKVHPVTSTSKCRVDYGSPAGVACTDCGAAGSWVSCKGLKIGFHSARMEASAKKVAEGLAANALR